MRERGGATSVKYDCCPRVRCLMMVRKYPEQRVNRWGRNGERKCVREWWKSSCTAMSRGEAKNSLASKGDREASLNAACLTQHFAWWLSLSSSVASRLIMFLTPCDIHAGR